MNTYIALFRGINVGGKTSLPMKGLVAIGYPLFAHTQARQFEGKKVRVTVEVIDDKDLSP